MEKKQVNQSNVGNVECEPHVISGAEEQKRNEMHDRQSKVMQAISDGNSGQLVASIYGELSCRLSLIEMRIEEIEKHRR